MSGKKTILYDTHKSLGAKFTEFGGFDMPVWFKGTKDEYVAVREKVGMFDINHMGQIIITGKDRFKLVNYVITNDLKKIDLHQIQYSYICNEDGIILDDLLVYLLGDKILLVVNAGQADILVNHINKHGKGFEYQIENISDQTGFIAVQGPLSLQLCEKIFGEDFESLNYYSFKNTEFDGHEFLISRTGYTGEKGVELIFNIDYTTSIWNTFLKEGKSLGVEPCGLAVRDVLRLEMGYPLWGHELKDYTPFDIKKMWCVSMKKEDFIGKAKLEAQKAEGAKTSLVAFTMCDKGIPREKCTVSKDNNVIGMVTSGGFSFQLNNGIGLCLIDADQANVDNEIMISIRGKDVPAKITKLPFIPSRVK